MKRQRITITIFVLAFTACELIIAPDLPEHTPRLVIKAFFTPDGGWAASVSRSVGILDPSPGPERLVTAASVELLSDGRIIDRLTFLQRERVYASENPLQAGRSYSLRVSAPGFETVHATDSAPPPVPTSIESYSVETSDRGETSDPSPGEPGLLEITDFRITLLIQDPPGKENRYQIRVFASGRSERRDLHFSTRDPSIISANRIEDPVLEGVEPFVGSEPFFSDALFNGESHEIELTSSDLAVEASLERVFWVQVRYVSEAYFRHLESALLHEQTQDNPFAEPASVYSNVRNGYGIFAGYSSKTFELEF